MDYKERLKKVKELWSKVTIVDLPTETDKQKRIQKDFQKEYIARKHLIIIETLFKIISILEKDLKLATDAIFKFKKQEEGC